MSHDLDKAEMLWRQCTMTGDAPHEKPTKSKAKATRQQKPKKQYRHTHGKNMRN
jgi:hypothetical protein